MACDDIPPARDTQAGRAIDEEEAKTDSLLSLLLKIKQQYMPADLAHLVYELKEQEASQINDRGIDEQLEYLLEKKGATWLKEVLGL